MVNLLAHSYSSMLFLEIKTKGRKKSSITSKCPWSCSLAVVVVPVRPPSEGVRRGGGLGSDAEAGAEADAEAEARGREEGGAADEVELEAAGLGGGEAGGRHVCLCQETT